MEKNKIKTKPKQANSARFCDPWHSVGMKKWMYQQRTPSPVWQKTQEDTIQCRPLSLKSPPRLLMLSHDADAEQWAFEYTHCSDISLIIVSCNWPMQAPLTPVVQTIIHFGSHSVLQLPIKRWTTRRYSSAPPNYISFTNFFKDQCIQCQSVRRRVGRSVTMGNSDPHVKPIHNFKD